MLWRTRVLIYYVILALAIPGPVYGLSVMPLDEALEMVGSERRPSDSLVGAMWVTGPHTGIIGMRSTGGTWLSRIRATVTLSRAYAAHRSGDGPAWAWLVDGEGQASGKTVAPLARPFRH